MSFLMRYDFSRPGSFHPILPFAFIVRTYQARDPGH